MNWQTTWKPNELLIFSPNKPEFAPSRTWCLHHWANALQTGGREEVEEAERSTPF